MIFISDPGLRIVLRLKLGAAHSAINEVDAGRFIIELGTWLASFE